MKHTKKTILIKGAFGYENFGDDALMIAAHEIIKSVFPNEKISVLCDNNSYIKKIINSVNILERSNEHKEKIDIIIYGGGTQFYSFPLTKQASLFSRIVKHAIKPKIIIKKLMFEIRKRFNSSIVSKTYAIGIGIGPFVENCKNISIARNIFCNMDYIAVRDIMSYELCSSWGCKKLSFCADICYLPGLWDAYLSKTIKNNKVKKINSIGVIIRDWPHSNEGNSYIDPLFKTVDLLRSYGKSVDFISFSKKYDKDWSQRLDERGEKCEAWEPEMCNISDFLKSLSTYDIFITTRYHGAVFSSILSKPVLCIEIEQKLRLVSDLFGGGARLWTYPFTVLECLDLISDLDARYQEAVEHLTDVVQKQGFLVEKMVTEFKDSTDVYFLNVQHPTDS